MIKITILFLLAMFWSESSLAVVYQCRDKAGNIFLTNDRSKFPPGCEQFGETFGEQPPPPPAVTPPAAPIRNEPGMSERRRSPSPPPSPEPQPTQDQSKQQEFKPATPATETEPPDEEEK